MLFVHATLGQEVPSSDVMLVPSEDLEDFRHRSSLNDGCYLFKRGTESAFGPTYFEMVKTL